jgi:outer membrane receptor protein involved in Fe transport
LLASTPASAQEQAVPQEQAQTGDAQVSADIVVTANKREQKLNDVGLTITALSGEALANQGISNVAELTKAVPGLTYAPTVNAVPVYTLRGVGFFESSLAAYPDVSLYIDQVPLAFPILASHAIFDLERVEVLKGPQGTLFGNNATGGAINFIAAKPTNSLSAGAEVTYGRFNNFEASGFISGPLSDTLRARLTFKVQNSDGWQKSYTRTDEPTPPALIAAGVPANLTGRQDRLGKRDNIAGRFLLDWTPTERLSVSLNVNGWRDQDEPQAPQLVGHAPANPIGTVGPGGTVTADMPIVNYPLAPRDARSADWSTTYRPFSDSKFYQSSARIDYELSDDVTVTSLSSYAHLDFLNASEGDATALNALDIGRDKGKIKTFSQELRLSSNPINRLRWVLGVNYENSDVDEEIKYYIGDSTAARFAGYGANGYYSNQRMRNYAVFGNVEFDVSDTVVLKGGIRQTKAKRSSENSTFELVGDPGNVAPVITLTDFLNGVYQAVFGPQTPTILPGESISFNPATGRAETFFGKLNENSTSWSAGVDYKPSRDLLFYANVSRGYKAGSFATVAAATFAAYAPVTQESILDYEVGFKSTLANGALQINGAAFYYDYTDKQLRAKFVDPVFGLLDRLVNVPKSKIKGAEFEITARPLEGLTLTAAGTYLDAKISDYVGVVGITTDPMTGFRVPVNASFSGVRLPYSPKFQFTTRADYTFPLSSSLNGLLGVSVNGQTRSIGILTLSAADRETYALGGRALVDLNVGIESADKRWKANLWGKNVFDKYYRTTTNLSNDTIFTFTGRPAEYGVTVGYKF